jgi:PAS domain S-box-containing protein
MTDENNKKPQTTKFEAIFNATLDGLLLLDQDRKIFDANEAAVNILGYPKDELIGKKLVDLHTEEYRSRCSDNIEKAFRGERACCDCPFVDFKGKLIFADNLLNKVEIGDSEYVLVSFHDITQQQEAEKMLEIEMETLRKMNELMMGREKRILELKDEIQNMKKSGDGGCDCERDCGSGK